MRSKVLAGPGARMLNFLLTENQFISNSAITCCIYIIYIQKNLEIS